MKYQLIVCLRRLTVSCCVLLAATAATHAAEPLAGKPYADVLGKGLNATVETVVFPQGEIQILDEGSQTAESQAELKFSHAYYTTFLKKAEAKGLLEITEAEKPAADAAAAAAPQPTGAKAYRVKPTPKLLELSDKARSTEKWLQVNFGKAEITEIVKDVPYANAPASEDYRLVVGKFDDVPNAAATELNEPAIASNQKRELKFRALLKYNLFTKSYVFITADFGELTQETWTTNFIR